MSDLSPAAPLPRPPSPGLWGSFAAVTKYQLVALLVELSRGFAEGRPQQDETLATQ